MKYFILGIISFSLICTACEQRPAKVIADGELQQNKAGEEISFYTTDSIEIIGDLYRTDPSKPIILLFHQSGSNARGEYEPIIPKLLDNGYNVLAIDQRMGGQAYGSYNRTLANIPTNGFGDGYTYCDAYSNLEAALDYVISAGFSGDKILWGSSYSASLVIKLAHEHSDDVERVLAFSPASGGPMKNCHPNQYFETLNVPLLLLRPSSEMKNESSAQQFELATKFNHQTYVAKDGKHGSSMLVTSRTGNNTNKAWENVLAFLDKRN